VGRIRNVESERRRVVKVDRCVNKEKSKKKRRERKFLLPVGDAIW